MCDNNKKTPFNKKKLKAPLTNKKTPKTRRKRKQPEDEEDTPLCDYVKMCMQNRKRVADKLDSLGIGNITSKFRKVQKQMIPKATQPTKRSSKWNHAHNDVLSYKEENDQRYCKEGNELYNVNWFHCSKCFETIEGDNFTVPNVSNLVYVCLGLIKYSCGHTFCYSCYHSKAVDSEKTAIWRRSSRNNTNK